MAALPGRRVLRCSGGGPACASAGRAASWGRAAGRHPTAHRLPPGGLRDSPLAHCLPAPRTRLHTHMTCTQTHRHRHHATPAVPRRLWVNKGTVRDLVGNANTQSAVLTVKYRPKSAGLEVRPEALRLLVPCCLVDYLLTGPSGFVPQEALFIEKCSFQFCLLQVLAPCCCAPSCSASPRPHAVELLGTLQQAWSVVPARSMLRHAASIPVPACTPFARPLHTPAPHVPPRATCCRAPASRPTCS